MRKTEYAKMRSIMAKLNNEIAKKKTEQKETITKKENDNDERLL